MTHASQGLGELDEISATDVSEAPTQCRETLPETLYLSLIHDIVSNSILQEKTL